MRRFRDNTRGSSTIIVIVLGLVIVIAIVVDVFLWNYELNQLDYEKTKENVTITGVTSVNNPSSWFVAQTEITTNNGSQVSGNVVDTHAVDANCERFREEGEGSNTTLINAESFEGTWPPTGWSETGRWNKESNRAYDGTYSADFDGGGGYSGDLTTFDLDVSDADAIYVDFWYNDGGCESNEFELYYYNGVTWEFIADLGTGLEDHWLHYQQRISDSQYLVSTFKIRWHADTTHSSDDMGVDLVTVKKESVAYRLDLNGTFNIDLSVYPSRAIQTVEVQLRYMADDSGERWYLNAYNWTAATYSNTRFNSTTGHTPTTEWDYYTVNFTNQWSSYVHNNGTVDVQIVDEGGDATRTTIDLDFLAVRVETKGAQFTFYNDGSFTCHLVSLWVNNATHHRRYGIDLFINVADTDVYTRLDVDLPYPPYTVKVVTERGNTAVHTES